MKKALLIFLILAFEFFPQGLAGEDSQIENRFLIDMPTSGVVPRGKVSVSVDVMPFGIVVGKMEVGVFDDVSFGISYGGANIIGSGTPDWYKLPGVNLRYKVLGESLSFPSLTLGFDSQGKGQYFESVSRFAIKSPGFFAAGSKNFELLGYLSVHGAMNYSLEKNDGDNFVNFTIGAEKTIGKKLSVVSEYDFTFNDNSTNVYGKGNGYLNFGIRWSISESFLIGLDLRDMLNNKKWSPGSADRAIRLEYIKAI